MLAAHGDDIHQISGELSEFRDTALDIERALLRVESHREIVKSHLHDVLPDLLRVVGIVGESLHVSHKDKHAVVVAFVLQLHATAQAAHIVSQVELARWAVTCQNNLSHVCNIVCLRYCY